MYQVLTESSLNRIIDHNNQHQCACITAFRKWKEKGKILFTKNEKLQRNKSLLSKLLSEGYKTIAVSGQFPEGGKMVKENTYFVINVEDKPDFFDNIIKLGIEFDQDSVLLIPVGAMEGKDKFCFVGTNYDEDNWLSFGERKYMSKVFYGRGPEELKELFKKLYPNEKFYDTKTKVGDRPFVLHEELYFKECFPPENMMGMVILNSIANKKWYDFIKENN